MMFWEKFYLVIGSTLLYFGILCGAVNVVTGGGQDYRQAAVNIMAFGLVFLHFGHNETHRRLDD